MNRRAGRKCSLMEKYRLKWNIQRFLSFDGLYKKNHDFKNGYRIRGLNLKKGI